MLVNEFLEKTAVLYPDKKALICRNRQISYKEVEAAANSLANCLIAKGIKRQDRVAILMENSIEAVVSVFAILKAGGVFVILNPMLKAPKLRYIFNDCGARVLITNKSSFALLSKITPACPSLESVVLTGADTSNLLGPREGKTEILSYEYLIQSFPNIRPVTRCIDIDLSCLIYTSGSTGNPKGVMLTHLNMVSAADSIIQYLENTSSDIIIDVLPLSFDYGLYQVLMAFKFGGTVVLEKAFVYPYETLASIIKYRVTGFPLVPTIAAILLTLKDLDQRHFPDLRYITNTGQTLPPALITRLRNAFPEAKLYSMYGLTECKRVSYLPPEDLDRRPDSVGKAMPNTEAYIVDAEGKEISVPRRRGQLVVRGANVMKGYWNLPVETAKSLRPGRYPREQVLYTGDIFEKDEDGFLFYIGRTDDMFKSSGELVSPKEIENVLCSCEGVEEAAVVGVDDDILGKAVKAFVVVSEGSNLTEKNVKRFCSQNLAASCVPKYISFRSSLPTTANGKIDKLELLSSHD